MIGQIRPVMGMFSIRRFFVGLIFVLVIINFFVFVLKPNTLRQLIRDKTLNRNRSRLQSWAVTNATIKPSMLPITHPTTSESITTKLSTQKAAKNKRDQLMHKQETCVLPKVDPWDPSIRYYLNPQKNPLKDCKVSFEKRSFIDSSGYLWIRMPSNASEIQATADTHELNEPEICSYRCVDSIDGSHLKLGKWAEISPNNMTKPECDIFEVYCSRNEKETYKYLHGQIIPKTSSPIKPPENAPDVHIILIDGVSFQHLLRALPMTVNYLRTEMEATLFKYFNKVGLNSRPNFYALFLGERAEDMEPNPWGPKEYMPGRDQELCKKYLEEEYFAFIDYQMVGYRSMWAEDWWDATPRWPNCWGFKDKPVDHFLQSYALRAWQNNTEKLWERVFNLQCRESYDYVLDILEDFVDKYQNKPKISLSWMTNVAHDNANVLYHTDQHYFDFFKRMNKKFANSFVLFMSDHGNRYLLPTSTNIGEVEISNPFLALVLPEKLRKNKDLVNQLYKNSNELMTHFDIYATLLEIASDGSEWTAKTKFSDKKYTAVNRTLKGSSLLHPLDYPRSCESLEIPFQYCLCRHEYKEFQDAKISLAIAEAVVKRMNSDLKASDVASKCVDLSVNATATSILPLREFEPQDDDKRIFRASIRTLPSNGQHDAFAEYDKNGVVTLISTRFGRNDSYKKQAHCISEQFLKNYCYCKEQLPEEKKKS